MESERIVLCYYQKCSLCYITAQVGELNGLTGPLKKKIIVTNGRYTQMEELIHVEKQSIIEKELRKPVNQSKNID